MQKTCCPPGDDQSDHNSQHDRHLQPKPQQNHIEFDEDSSQSSDDPIVCVHCEKSIKRSKIYKHLKRHKNKARKQPPRGVDDFWGWKTFTTSSNPKPKRKRRTRDTNESKDEGGRKGVERIKKVIKKKRSRNLQILRLGGEVEVQGREVGKYKLKRRKFKNLDFKKYLQPQKQKLKRQQSQQSELQQSEQEQSLYEEYKPSECQESQKQQIPQNGSGEQNEGQKKKYKKKQNKKQEQQQGSEMRDESEQVIEITNKLKKKKRHNKKVIQEKNIKNQQGCIQKQNTKKQKKKPEAEKNQKNQKEKKKPQRKQKQEQKNKMVQKKKKNYENNYPKITVYGNCNQNDIIQKKNLFITDLEQELIKQRKTIKQNEAIISKLKTENEQLKQQNKRLQTNISQQSRVKIQEKNKLKVQDSPSKNIQLRTIKFSDNTPNTHNKEQKKSYPKQNIEKRAGGTNVATEQKLKQTRIDLEWFKKDHPKKTESNNKTSEQQKNKQNSKQSEERINISDFTMVDQNKEQENQKNQKK